MARVDAAEKEASEVLHSLLSVERIEKPEQVIVVTTTNDPSSPSPHSFQSSGNVGDSNDANSQIQWHTPVSIATHSLFTAINEANTHFPQSIDEQPVIWEGHTIQVSEEQNTINTLYIESPPNQIQSTVTTNVKKELPTITTTTAKITKLKALKKRSLLKKKRKVVGAVNSNISNKTNNNNHTNNNNNETTKVEDSAAQVKERFRRGCECQDESCFRGLSPENVYRHRLNIAELTKSEHDMYLMGVTMACLADPVTTVRHKERRRLRAQYVYQGRRVCLDAFLYLENCTHYQLKRIRKHVMTHGVAPRVHGNHGKKPHNTFSLDIYRHATEFLKQYLETHTGETGITNTKQIIQLPWDITRKNLHDAYKQYGQILEPGIKLMGYSTFRHFMKEQFPHVRFCKVEPKTSGQHNQQNNQPDMQQQQQQQQQQPSQSQQQQQQQHTFSKPNHTTTKTVISSNEVQQVVPLIVTQGSDNGAVQHHQQTAFLVTPVPQLLPNGNIISAQNTSNHIASNTAFSYQLTNAGYVINEQGNLVTTMTTNPQHHPPYTFNRI